MNQKNLYMISICAHYMTGLQPFVMVVEQRDEINFDVRR